MRVLMIHCHPRPDSYSRALREAALEGLRQAGHEVELRDLYAEGFQPAMTAEERPRYARIEPGLPGLEDHVESLRAAEALVLVYPTWWYGMPALLKGWFDRVWAPGIAFTLGGGAIRPALTNIRRIAVVTTYGSPTWLLWWIGWPDHKQVSRGLRRLCAKGCALDWLYLNNMDRATQAQRDGFATRVKAHFARW
ncbi:MAG: NAD(P)H-dependent oxidoreductase [Acetobacteraceae bacterium]|nr:NAD(P)H-dependent oxidoreductase [Acetobacteraceae bacterium]